MSKRSKKERGREVGFEETKTLTPTRLAPLQVPGSPTGGVGSSYGSSAKNAAKGVRTPGGGSAGMSLRTPGGTTLSPSGGSIKGSFTHSMQRERAALDSRGASYGAQDEEFAEVLFPPRSPHPLAKNTHGMSKPGTATAGPTGAAAGSVGFEKESLQTARQFAMSYQHAFAARTMQKYWRGWHARVSMWRWGGIMLTSRALKIQRVWRGRSGRKVALKAAKRRLADIANKIKGQYLIWLAKRQLRVLSAEKTHERVVMIQCLYRTRLARYALGRARFIHHTRMATKIQSLARGRLGRRRYRGIQQRLRSVFNRMSKTMLADVKLSQARVKPSMQSLAAHTDRSSAWELLETTLFHTIGTVRRDVSVDLAAELLIKHPHFAFGRFALQVVLFLTFTCSGPTSHVRMDMLDELVGCLYYNQQQFCTESDFNNASVNNVQSPEAGRSDPASQHGWEDGQSGAMDELEMMYFRNSFLRHGKSAHSLTVMAACVLNRLAVADWCADRTAVQARQVDRARHLLVFAAARNTANSEEALCRLDVMENIFSRPHRIILSRTVTYNGVRQLGYKAYNLLHNSHKMAMKDSLLLDVEVLRCGEMIVVRAKLLPLPVSLKAVSKARKFNNIPPFAEDAETGDATGIDMAPKWTSYTADYEKRAKEYQTAAARTAARAAELLRLEEEDGDDEGMDFDGASASAGAGDGMYQPLLSRAGTYDDSSVGGGESVGSLDDMSVGTVGTVGTADTMDSDGDANARRASDAGTAGRAEGEGEEASPASSPSPKPKRRPKWKEEPQEKHPYLPELVVRPLVLIPREVAAMTNIALSHYAAEQGIEEDELRAQGMTSISVLAQYLLQQVRVSTCRSRLVLDAETHQMASLKVSLPQLEYRRLEQNNTRTVDFSVKLIQRIYRGSRGKHRFRRIWFRSKEKARQHAALTTKRQTMAEVRDHRYHLLCKIQASVKAWSWRRLMARMRKAATMFQCVVRCFIARNTVEEERRRRTMGPEVHEMTRRTVEVGALKFTLIVYRCGNQYKLLGYDLLQVELYEGIVLQGEVQALCNAHNCALTGTALQVDRARIAPKSYQKVTELIVHNLGVARAMSGATTTLGAIPEHSERRKYILVMKPYATVDVPGIAAIRNLGRVLKDTQGVVQKYEKMLAREAKQDAQRAAGLLPPKPKPRKKRGLQGLGM